MGGTELLVIDTEGHDMKIIRSMIQYCTSMDDDAVWPDVIAMETCGICDQTEGVGTEAATIKQLEGVGYAVFMKHWMNTHMVRKAAIPTSQSLRRWLRKLYLYGQLAN